MHKMAQIVKRQRQGDPPAGWPRLPGRITTLPPLRPSPHNIQEASSHFKILSDIYATEIELLDTQSSLSAQPQAQESLRRRARATDALKALLSRRVPARVKTNFNHQIPARPNFLHDKAEVRKYFRRRKLQSQLETYKNFDGYTRHSSPPREQVGRRDKLGRPVPALTLTTPDVGETPGTGQTFYLRENSPESAVRRNTYKYFSLRGKGSPRSKDSSRSAYRVTPERYEKMGKAIEARRNNKARADAQHKASVDSPLKSASADADLLRRSSLDGADQPGLSGKKRTPRPDSRPQKPLELGEHGEAWTGFKAEEIVGARRQKTRPSGSLRRSLEGESLEKAQLLDSRVKSVGG